MQGDKQDKVRGRLSRTAAAVATGYVVAGAVLGATLVGAATQAQADGGVLTNVTPAGSDTVNGCWQLRNECCQEH